MCIRDRYDNERIGKKTLGNGIVIDYSYNAARMMTGITSTNTLFDFQYNYDANQNRIKTDRLHNPTQSEIYEYDERQRLLNTKVGMLVGNNIPTPSSQDNFVYDPLGNRISKDGDETLTSYSKNNLNQYLSLIHI